MPRLTAPLFILTLVAAACAPSPADVPIERLDVAVAVQSDGSARVEERITARFGNTPTSSFRRRVPVWRHDGVTDIAATTDGASVTVGDASIRIHVGTGPDLDVQWTFAPASATTRVFGLAYTARNVVSLSGIRGTVSWLALPATRDFDVSAASISITLTVPESAILLQDPWVEEAGWTVTRQAHGLTATRSNIGKGESATAGLEFTIDQLAAVKPTWQFHADQANEFIAAFVSAGLFILVIGAGVIVMLRFKYPPSSVPAMDPDRLASARDLRTTAWVVLVVGVAAWAVVAKTLSHFGIWPLAIPASMLIVGMLFLVAAARMLYFARVPDGRNSV